MLTFVCVARETDSKASFIFFLAAYNWVESNQQNQKTALQESRNPIYLISS